MLKFLTSPKILKCLFESGEWSDICVCVCVYFWVDDKEKSIFSHLENE